MNFNFGANPPDKPPTGVSGLPALQTTTAGTTGFHFGSTTSDAAQTAASTAAGFQLKPTLPTTSLPSFSLGGGAPASVGTPSFSLPTSTTTSTGLSLGGVGTGSTGFSLGGTPSTAAITSTVTGFPAAAASSTAAPTFGTGFSLPAPATTTTASTGFMLGGTATSAAPGFSLPAATTTATSTGLTGGLLLGGATTSTASTTGSTSFAMPLNFGQATSTIPTTTSTASSLVPSAGAGGTGCNLNFGQLEETINKWTMDLEEQEKLFMNQATQVNAWDHLLTTNGEKIVQLNEAVEAVKVEQQQLDHELDFILAQQRELEDCLVPLEKELASTAVLDPERQHTYELAEAMDTQLKQMSEDLREIIEYLNENNRSQDSSDPLVQIGRILNAHMNSLQWIDQNTAVIQNHLDQVVKLHESHRRDNERSFHVPYS